MHLIITFLCPHSNIQEVSQNVFRSGKLPKMHKIKKFLRNLAHGPKCHHTPYPILQESFKKVVGIFNKFIFGQNCCRTEQKMAKM